MCNGQEHCVADYFLYYIIMCINYTVFSSIIRILRPFVLDIYIYQGSAS